MRILCIGDVVSIDGAQFVMRTLPRLKAELKPDCVIINGENSALYNGIDKQSYEMLLSAGADIITGGNHSFQKPTAPDLHDSAKRLVRPANVTAFTSGVGELTVDFGRFSLRVINLSGTLYMNEPCENPFEYALRAISRETNAVTVVDFHAEATSEKRAMGFLLDGKVSLVFGTHTHVQTNDAQILKGGTGYITDLGMTGVKHSVLGKDTSVCVHNFLYPNDRQKIKDAAGDYILSGIVADIDLVTKKCTSITTINIDNLK